MLRVRFAPSPTGFLHIGSARTFIFNWLYARRNGGTMILRIDDTDVERNTEQSLQSIFDGLNGSASPGTNSIASLSAWRFTNRWPKHLSAWDGLPGFHACQPRGSEKSRADGPWLFNTGMRDLSPAKASGAPQRARSIVLRFRVPREGGEAVRFTDAVYGEQSKATADIEDFALLRSDGMPTYHLASCADDVDLKISHIIRGQDHLSNTFKHILIFEAAGATPPTFAHLPLLVAPDGAKLSKRRHGPVVSVTTYRDAGFLPHAYVNFLCLLGWSPKDNREQMKLEELISAFSFEGINRSNAVVNFKEDDPIDPKALWLNSQHLRAIPMELLVPLVKAELIQAGIKPPYDDAWLAYTVDLLRARYFTLKDFAIRGKAYFSDEFIIEPDALAKLDIPGTREALRKLADKLAANPEFTEASVAADLRGLAGELGVKAGLLINGARAALTGQPAGPSAFHLFLAIGRDRAIARLKAI